MPIIKQSSEEDTIFTSSYTNLIYEEVENLMTHYEPILEQTSCSFNYLEGNTLQNSLSRLVGGNVHKNHNPSKVKTLKLT